MSKTTPHEFTRVDWRDGFDWETRKPTGRPLTDRRLMKAQQEGRVWFKLHFREEYVDLTPYSEALVRKTLVLVEAFKGKEMIRSEVMDVEIPVEKREPDASAALDPDSI
jgi:hypothetical protein